MAKCVPCPRVSMPVSPCPRVPCPPSHVSVSLVSPRVPLCPPMSPRVPLSHVPVSPLSPSPPCAPPSLPQGALCRPAADAIPARGGRAVPPPNPSHNGRGRDLASSQSAAAPLLDGQLLPSAPRRGGQLGAAPLAPPPPFCSGRRRLPGPGPARDGAGPQRGAALRRPRAALRSLPLPPSWSRAAENGAAPSRGEPELLPCWVLLRFGPNWRCPAARPPPPRGRLSPARPSRGCASPHSSSRRCPPSCTAFGPARPSAAPCARPPLLLHRRRSLSLCSAGLRRRDTEEVV